MTKICGICGNKLTWYKLRFKDGAMCENCLLKYKFGTKWKIESTASFNLSDELAKNTIDKINNLDLPREYKQALIDAKIFDIFAVKKELSFLSKIIDLKLEKIIYACSGTLNGHTWLIVCTTEKMIFINKNLLYGMQEKDIPLNAINYTQGAVLGSLSITNGANNFEIININKMAARIMAKKIQETQSNIIKVQNTNSSNTTYDELRELKRLLDDGIITEEEFTAKKKQILNI